MTNGKRIGLLGGSFDPVHLGHLMAAQDAFEGMALDRVVLVPAARSPLKVRNPIARDEDRVALLRAAIDGDPRFTVSTSELERGGTSYTIDTVNAFTADTADRYFWIIGADQAASLKAWYRIDDLVRKVEFIVLARPGSAWDPADMPGEARFQTVDSHLMAVSSSDIRDRVRNGKSIRFLVPEDVASEIEKRHLYG
jgi:nicotinate-nucleotide adenylyltransferase